MDEKTLCDGCQHPFLVHTQNFLAEDEAGECNAEGCSCMAFEEPCPDCGGTGEIEVQSPVYPGEPHMAYLGDKKTCHCRARENDGE